MVCLVRGGRQARGCPRSVMVGQIPMLLGVSDDPPIHGDLDLVSNAVVSQIALSTSRLRKESY